MRQLFFRNCFSRLIITVLKTAVFFDTFTLYCQKLCKIMFLDQKCKVADNKKTLTTKRHVPSSNVDSMFKD